MEKQTKHTPEPIGIYTVDFYNINVRDAETLRLKEKCETAYNDTYGKGINPEAVEIMLLVLEDINGYAEEQWGKDYRNWPAPLARTIKTIEEARNNT